MQKDIDYTNVFLTFLLLSAIITILGLFSTFAESSMDEEHELSNLIKRVKNHYKKGDKKEDIYNMLKAEGHDEQLIIQAVNLNSKNIVHYYLIKFEVGIIECIFLILIALNFIEMFQILSILPGHLSGDFSFVKNLISWTVLSYVLYRVSLSKLLFGVKKRRIDVLLLVIFFLMIIKNFISSALSSIIDARFFRDIFVLTIRYNDIIEKYFLIVGIGLLFVISIYLTFKLEYQKPSVVNLINYKSMYVKFLLTFFALVAFYVTIYNFMFEWLAIVVDSQLGVILTIWVLYSLIKHYKNFKFSNALTDMSSTAESFYERVIDGLKYKKTFHITIAGMLVLHAASEIGVFVLPYVTGFVNNVYSTKEIYPLFNLLNFHPDVPSLFATQTAEMSFFNAMLIFIIYIANILFMFFLFGLPLFVWYQMFKYRKMPLALVKPINLRRRTIVLIIFSAIIFLMVPVFNITFFSSRNFETIDYSNAYTGLDILTTQTKGSFDYLILAVIIASCSALVAYILSIKKELKGTIQNYIFSLSSIALGIYLILFFISTSRPFIDTISDFKILTGSFSGTLLILCLLLLLLINIIFYLGGIVMYYIELWNRREFPFEDLAFKKLVKVTNHTDMHHVNYYEFKDEFYHKESVDYVVDYMKKSLELGHDMFRINEFLEEHGWPYEIIKEAQDIIKEKHKDKFGKHLIQVHTKKELEVLYTWFKTELDKNTTLELLTEAAIKSGWTEDDIQYVLNHIESTKEDEELDLALDEEDIEKRVK